MSYIKFIDYPANYPKVPEMSVGAGSIDLQKIYAFAKRTITGNMLLRGYKGSVFKVTGKWNFLSREQYNGLCSYISANDSFDILIYDPSTFGTEKKTIKVYAGDMHAEPFLVDPETGLPRYYRNCTVNFISVPLLHSKEKE